VDTQLHNVCPNCGGGFVARPIRPKIEHRRGTSLEHQPASSKRVRSAYSNEQIAEFVNGVKDIPAEQR
jgi:hypothetical protein